MHEEKWTYSSLSKVGIVFDRELKVKFFGACCLWPLNVLTKLDTAPEDETTVL
ncbi:hypothetical protein Lalb_Chr17g0339881 [Lupinus albus]|uniref:Uncharacterized protein n=1 Tax=Lupinus albus TaxID=3870 RepID=A0A6A4P295_LUPAL|nr:hypothetical protein Lalb_Chr17g0339881 [Lupinus albus]